MICDRNSDNRLEKQDHQCNNREDIVEQAGYVNKGRIEDDNSTRMNRETRRLKIKMVRYNGTLIYEEEITDKGNKEEKSYEQRFSNSHKEEIILEATFDWSNRAKSKEVNIVKITNFLVKFGFKVDKVRVASAS